jgi:hypothetical protein
MNAISSYRKDRSDKSGGKPAAKKGKMALGQGGRFKELVAKLQGKVNDPKAVAAAIGRKKYGNRRMQQMASAGRKS